MIKMMVTVVIVFTMCWLPFNVLSVGEIEYCTMAFIHWMDAIVNVTLTLANQNWDNKITSFHFVWCICAQIIMNNTDLSKWDSIIYIWFIFHWLAMSHSCYNPVIYCYMNARFRIGFLQVLYFIPGIRRCCCINAYARARSTSLRTGIALTGE